MSKYYYTDGKERFGPFSLEELGVKKISKETLVWMEGLTDWIPAGNLAELQSLFPIGMPNLPHVGAPYTPVIMEKAPKNWLVESVLITLLCCPNIFGIIGIIHATKIETLWSVGQRDAAIKASKDAGMWVRIGFFVGLSIYLLYFLFMFLGIVTAIGTNLNDQM